MSDRPPDSASASLGPALWPAAEAGEALRALAKHAGLPISVDRDIAGAGATDDPEAQVAIAAERLHLHAEQVFAAPEEVAAMLRHCAPAILRLASLNGSPFLAIVGVHRRSLLALGPDLQVHKIPLDDVCAAVQGSFAVPDMSDVDSLVRLMGLQAHKRDRLRRQVANDHLRHVRFKGCWLVRLPSDAKLCDEFAQIGLLRRAATLLAVYLGQYLLFIVSWWLLGSSVLNATVDTGWLLGWMLLILSVIPLRLLATWTQGAAAVSAATTVRRRLLHGAFTVNREEIKRHGPGRLFGVVLEMANVESLALSGGVLAALSLIELVIAAVVLGWGATSVPRTVLALWAMVVSAFGWLYFKQRQLWTDRRMNITDRLLESMLGHRTRLVQEPVADWHAREDQALDDYLVHGSRMDRTGTILTALAARGWLILALISLIPVLLAGSTPTVLAISLGGVLLAYRALQRFSTGLFSLAGAVIASRIIAPVAGARLNAASPVSTRQPPPRTDTESELVLLAKDVTFRYPQQVEQVLRGCSLRIARGNRFLLEGPSGSGKTTFASVIAGLLQPDSGLLLVDGLDRATTGAGGWRRHVVMAPQAHDNYLLAGSLAFNLLMGRRWPAEARDIEEAEAVCRELGLADLLDRLPSGLHQIVGETGWQLSQGERVRVFLARALLQRPDLLILDESFSALDAENVDRAMRCVLSRSMSVLAIAHV